MGHFLCQFLEITDVSCMRDLQSLSILRGAEIGLPDGIGDFYLAGGHSCRAHGVAQRLFAELVFMLGESVLHGEFQTDCVGVASETSLPGEIAARVFIRIRIAHCDALHSERGGKQEIFRESSNSKSGGYCLVHLQQSPE